MSSINPPIYQRHLAMEDFLDNMIPKDPLSTPYKKLSSFVDICIHNHSPWLFLHSPESRYTMVDKVYVVFDGFNKDEENEIKDVLHVPSNNVIVVNREKYEPWVNDGFVFTWESLWMHLEKTTNSQFLVYFKDGNGQVSYKRFSLDIHTGDAHDEYANLNDTKHQSIIPIIPWLTCQT